MYDGLNVSKIMYKFMYTRYMYKYLLRHKRQINPKKNTHACVYWVGFKVHMV